MRAIFLILSLMMFYSSCSKSTNEVPTVYSDSKGTSVSLTSSSWSAAKTTAGAGTVNLRIAGSTNAEILTVTTYGELSDGLVSDQPVTLDSKKNFDQTILISTKSTDVTTVAFETSTELKAYRGNDTLRVSLKSGALVY